VGFFKLFPGRGLRNENSFLQLQQIDQTARTFVGKRLAVNGLNRCKGAVR